MDHKLSIAERLAGSIQLDDQKLIDEIIESEIWNYDEMITKRLRPAMKSTTISPANAIAR